MEIKNCPFCGSKAEYLEHMETDSGTNYTVGDIRCVNSKCGCRTRGYIVSGYYGIKTIKEDIYRVWNSRV